VLPIAFLLVDDVSLIRDNLKTILHGEADLRLVGEAEDGLQAVALAAKFFPDVVLMDVSMPGLNGMEAMQRILQSRPVTKVLMLSAHSDDAYVMRSRTLGASAYLSKQGDLSQLAQVIRWVFKGGAFVGPHDDQPDAPAPPEKTLPTPRSKRGNI
jgi:DNA-binding NarL/FixJ family response regulator